MLHTHVSEQYGPFHNTDNAGFTDHVYALCALRGFRSAPRIRDLADKRLDVPGTGNQWSALECMIGRPLNVKPIERAFHAILRPAASIRPGHITAFERCSCCSGYVILHCGGG